MVDLQIYPPKGIDDLLTRSYVRGDFNSAARNSPHNCWVAYSSKIYIYNSVVNEVQRQVLVESPLCIIESQAPT
jgi:hypothetical protein